MRVHVKVERIMINARRGSERQLQRLLGGAIARELGADGAPGLDAATVSRAVRRGVDAALHGDGDPGRRPEARQ